MTLTITLTKGNAMIDNTIEAFLKLLRVGLWGNGNLDLQIDGTTDWQEVYRLATEQSVLGLVLAGLEQCKNLNANLNLNQIVLLQWIGEVQLLEQRNLAMNRFVAELVEKMRAADIYVILVKGQGVAQCYEKPLWRACGDVDLYLSDTNFAKAKAFFRPLVESFDPDTEYAQHINMHYGDWVVEIHANQHCSLSTSIDCVMDEIHRDIFNGGRVRSWDNGYTQVFLPSPDNDVLIVFTHFLKHFYKGGLGVRQICDWCRLLYTYRDSLNYGLLEQRIRKMGLMSEWRAFYNLASRYLGMPDLGSGLMVHDSRFDKKADRIMEFILKSGNMGHKRGSWLMEHDSWLTRQYVVKKAFSMFRRIGDLINHARIFPMDSLRFFPYIVFNGIRSAIRGE